VLLIPWLEVAGNQSQRQGDNTTMRQRKEVPFGSVVTSFHSYWPSSDPLRLPEKLLVARSVEMRRRGNDLLRRYLDGLNYFEINFRANQNLILIENMSLEDILANTKGESRCAACCTHHILE
jgi:hypothetical protein